MTNRRIQERIPEGHDILDQVGHWTRTPAFSYLGSSYGNRLKEVLYNPFNSGLAEEQAEKLPNDVPAVSMLPSDAVQLYVQHVDPDKTHLVLAIAGNTINVGTD